MEIGVIWRKMVHGGLMRGKQGIPLFLFHKIRLAIFFSFSQIIMASFSCPVELCFLGFELIYHNLVMGRRGGAGRFLFLVDKNGEFWEGVFGMGVT
jgi:hypothetical protein